MKTKRSRLFYTIAFFCWLMVQTVSAQDVYRVTNHNLNVRSKPSSSSQKLGQLKAGDKITVLSISNGWAQFVFKSQKAYVSASFIELIDDDDETLPDQPIQSEKEDENSDIDYSVVTTSYDIQDSIRLNSGEKNYIKFPKLFLCCNPSK